MNNLKNRMFKVLSKFLKLKKTNFNNTPKTISNFEHRNNKERVLEYPLWITVVDYCPFNSKDLTPVIIPDSMTTEEGGAFSKGLTPVVTINK